jgi:SAM-dependent methyltransferase
MPPGVDYITLDYLSTATEWYGTRPDLYGDAQSLPVQDNLLDHALLLDVLEHLPDPHRSLAELHRVLKPGGSLTIQVPFLYPLHDEPLDFHRWTRHGLRLAAGHYGFDVAAEIAIGHPLESAALNANIAASKTVLNWATSWNPLALTGLLLPLTVLFTNCAAWALARLSRDDDFMPHAYRVIWIKK